MSSIDNKRINDYIDNVCNLIKNKKVHKDIKEEFLVHIEEIYEEYIEYGLSEEEAIEKAIIQMGPYELVGRDLNEVHKAMPDFTLLGFTLMFILIGIFTLSSLVNDAYSMEIYGNLAYKTFIYAIVSGVVVYLLLKIDYRNFKKYSMFVYKATLIVLILIGIGKSNVHGGGGWIQIGNGQVNLFSIAPFLFLISLSGIFDKWNWNGSKNLINGIIIGFGPSILFLMVNSMGNFIIYLISVVIIMHISGLRLKYIIGIICSTGVLGGLFILKDAYKLERLGVFLNPEIDPSGSGWIFNQLNSLRKASGLFGQSIGFKEEMLPSAHSEFIFTYIIYSFGLIVGIVIIAMILAFIIRIGLIGANTKDTYGKLLVSGFCTLFGVQFILSILMNFGIIPVIAICTPFISYSGAQLVINIIAIGIISNVYKWRNSRFVTV